MIAIESSEKATTITITTRSEKETKTTVVLGIDWEKKTAQVKKTKGRMLETPRNLTDMLIDIVEKQEAALIFVQKAAGAPDPVKACRNIIAIASEAMRP